eukprot:scaffold23107_cov28-Tisochrysis_lutea.AAC.2
MPPNNMSYMFMVDANLFRRRSLPKVIFLVPCWSSLLPALLLLPLTFVDKGIAKRPEFVAFRVVLTLDLLAQGLLVLLLILTVLAVSAVASGAHIAATVIVGTFDGIAQGLKGCGNALEGARAASLAIYPRTT